MNESFEKRNYKVSDLIPFLPYVLYESILKETNIKKEVCEELNSELWYETLNGTGKAIFNHMEYVGNINYGILDSRINKKKESKKSMLSNNSMNSSLSIKQDDLLLETDSQITFPDGTVYKGTVHNNVIDGEGTFYFPTGSVYEGQVKNGLREGYGIYECTKKNIRYEGNWRKGLKHGKGKLIKSDMIYEGEWIDGVINGKGKCRWTQNNNYYDGMFKNALLNGNGFFVWTQTNEKYCGNWLDNSQNGIGMQIWYEPKGELKLLRNRYIGEWKKGKRNGYGVFFYSNGSKYEGYWENDEKKGFGIFSFLDRTKTIGIFNKDKVVIPIDIDKPPNGSLPLSPQSNTTNKNSVNSSVINENTGNTKIRKFNKNIKDNDTISSNNNNSSQTNSIEEKKKTIIKNLNTKKIFIDISDLLLISPNLNTSLKEIDNILLRNLSDITHWYHLSINRNYVKEIDYASIVTNENITKTLANPQITTNNLNNNDEGKKENLTQQIETSIGNNDFSFCMELKDLWKFLRDYTGIVNYDFTIAEVDRYFYIGSKNYYEMFYFKEDMISLSPYKDTSYSDDEIYQYMYNIVLKEKYDFDCRYSAYSNNLIEYPKQSNNIISNTKNIHHRRNIVLLKHFYEILIRIAFFKTLNAGKDEDMHNKENKEISIEENLKSLLLYIKPIMRLKRKSVNYSKPDASSLSSHSALGDVKIKNIETLLESFMILYECSLIKLFNDIYLLSSTVINETDKTITYYFLHKKILTKIKNEIFNSMIQKKSSFCEIILSIPSKASINLNTSNISSLKRSSIFTSREENTSTKKITKLFCLKQEEQWKKYLKVLDSEMTCYEFCELIFYLCRKYFILTTSKEENYNEIIELIKTVVEQSQIEKHIRQQQKKGRKCYWYPKLKTHFKIEENERKRKKEIEEKMRRKKEKERYTLERNKFKSEDINIFKEEKYESDSEDDYDSN